MTRLPLPGGDRGSWGTILNDYLSQSHSNDGSLKSGTVGSSQLKDGAVTAGHIANGAVSKSDIGLGSVNNTSDPDKPLSTAAQTALAAKLATTDLDSQTAARINDGASAIASALNSSFVAPRGKTATGPSAALPYHNIRDYGAVGDGVADDTQAIQDALDAAGQGGRVFLPGGSYVITSTLNLPIWAMLEGDTSQIGAGLTSPTQLKCTSMSGAAVAVVMGANSTLRNLTIRGPGATVGTVKGITGATCFLDKVSILSFATGTHITGGTYCNFNGVEWSRNATSLTLTSCYNLNINGGCRFYCSYGAGDATHGIGITGSARGLNIFGGSIEGYSSGINLASASHLNLFGVYFETSLDANAAAVWADARNNISIVIEGCFIYLNGHSRFITTSGSTDLTLTSRGNHFVCLEASAQTPTAYIITPGQHVDLAGDNWSEVVKTGASYAGVSSGSLSGAGLSIAWPKGSSVAYGGATAVTTYGRRMITASSLQTLAANGAVTIDASMENHAITLQANATSLVITNPISDANVSITFIQDATGGRTYAWNSVCKFASNIAPSDTTPSTRTTVILRYNSIVNRWYEVSRAVAVPVS